MSSHAVPSFPALSILFASRRTVRAIVDRDPSHRVLWVSALSGIGLAVAVLAYLGIDLSANPRSLVALLLLDGPILGLVGVYLSSRLLSWSSQAVCSGRATELEVRAAVAWVSSAWIWIGALAVVRQRVAIPAGNQSLVLAFDVAAGTILALAFLALLRAIAEVERFSPWKTLLAVVVALLALSAALAIPVASLAVVLEFV